MKKQMKRTVYEAPVTERFGVELEGNFCGSIVTRSDGVKISAQEINNGFDTENSLGGNTWEKIEE